jgi:hypothetical protein
MTDATGPFGNLAGDFDVVVQSKQPLCQSPTPMLSVIRRLREFRGQLGRIGAGP